MNTREYFTDFEEIEGESGCKDKEKSIRTEPWSLEDFVPVFNSLGMIPDGQEYVSVRTVQTGRVILNGVEKVQTQELRISFRFDDGFSAELDGSELAGVWATVSVSGQVLLSELIYCVPEEIGKYYSVYLKGR